MPVREALPVAVVAAAQVAESVRRHVEGVLGWQVVGPRDGPLLRPAVVLADGSIEPRSVGCPPGLPTVLLAGDPVGADAVDGHGPVEVARRAIAVGADALLSWPSEREALPEVVEVALGRVGRERRGRSVGDATDRLVVGGAAGGVGTTTVALALAGLAAWRRRAVLAVVSGDVPVPDVPDLPLEALGGSGAWNAAVPVPATPDLRVLRVEGAAPTAEVEVPSLPAGALLVVDVGVCPEVTGILVARRDRAGAAAVGAGVAGGIVLRDEGPLEEREVLAQVRAGVVAVVPWSARVARAGVRRAVPRALPGTWLEPLRGLLPAGVHTLDESSAGSALVARTVVDVAG